MVTSLFTSLHGISHADGIFHGNSNYAPGISKWLRDGQPITAPFRYDWDGIAPIGAKAANLVVSQTWKTVGTMNFGPISTLVSVAGFPKAGGAASMDVPRCVSITPNFTFVTTGSIVVYGQDYYKEAMTESIAMNTLGGVINGKKAFMKINCIVNKTSLSAGAFSVGCAAIFGLPFAVAGAWDVISAWVDDTNQETLSNTLITKADVTSPATDHTGDIRGTYTPSAAAPNGVRKYRIWFTAKGKDTRNNLYGVPQFGGSA